jgi:lysophospholipase L1-like esterase
MKRVESFGLPRCARLTAAVMALTIFFTVAVGASSARSWAGPTPLTLVGIGDSIGDAANCQPCTSYVELYGQAATRALHRSVETTNLSQSTNLDSAGLLSLVRSNDVFRTNLASADLITVTIGNNDLAPCDFTPATDDACEAAIRQLRVNLKATLFVIKRLRHGRRTAVRVTDYFNSAIGDPAAPPGETFQQDFAEKLGEQNVAICSAARAAGAGCVDLVRPFNGPSGSEPANRFLMTDHIHPNAEGQRKIAKAISAVGFAPIGRCSLRASWAAQWPRATAP